VCCVDDLARRYLETDDELAIEELIRLTRRRLLAIARRIGAPQDAEDTVQSAYLSLSSRRGAALDAPVLAWLITATVRIAYRRKAQEQKQRDLAHALARSHESLSPIDAASRSELTKLLREEIGRLPPSFRDAVVLHYLEGLPTPEVAKLLEVPETTVRTRLHRSRALIREGWSPRVLYVLFAVPWLFGDAAAAVGATLLRAAPAWRLAAVLTTLLVFIAATATITIRSGGAERSDEEARAQRTVPGIAIDDGIARDVQPGTTGAPAATTATDGVSLIGRLVDERRQPVADGEVTAYRNTGEAVGVRTGFEGRFRVDVGRRPIHEPEILALHARSADGTLAVVHSVLFGVVGPSQEDAGTLVARAAHDAKVRVMRAGEPVPRARVLLAVADGAVRYPAGLAETDTTGHATFHGIPRRDLVVYARADGSGRGAKTALAGSALDHTIVVELPAERVVDIRVVDGGSGAPVPDAAVRVIEVHHHGGYVGILPYYLIPEVAPTDPEGRTQLRGLGSDAEVRLHLWASGYIDHRNGTTIPAGARAVEVELPARQEYTWTLLAGATPAPPEGATIRLRPRGAYDGIELPFTGVIRKGKLVVMGSNLWNGRVVLVGARKILATAPEGSVALLTKAPTTVFGPSHTLVMQARDGHGRPVAGACFCVRGEHDTIVTPFLRTDRWGVIRAEGLQDARVRVYQAPGFIANEDAWRHDLGRPLAEIDLAGRTEPFVLTLPDERVLTLRVSCDGRVGLPAEFHLRVNGADVRDIEEKPAAGLLRCKLRVPEEVGVELEAPGYVTARRSATLNGDCVEMELVSAGVIQVKVLAPEYEGMNAPHYYLPLLWRQADDGEWVFTSLQATTIPNLEHVSRFDDLTAGRYRVQDLRSGITTGTLDVRNGAAPVRAVLDLSQAVAVRGQVRAPEGTRLSDVRVVYAERFKHSEGHPWITDMGRVKPDGSFLICIPGDQPVTLRALCPGLPHADLRVQRDSNVVLELKPQPR